MTLTRRDALGLLAGSLAVPSLTKAATPFEATRESLKQYHVPEWFRDAKFGIWAHWGPQSAAEDGDWYARNMYIQGSEQYKYHVATHGHPSKFGFKDVIPTWKANKFDPDHLIGLYKKAGAKYFVSMGVHHDNFDLWNSKHTRWNAVNMGPQKDVVGMFRQAALREGLKFGVSEHLWISYKWFAVSHGSDKTGPLAGAPYDGVDPANADLYHESACAQFATGKLQWGSEGIPDSWRKHWFARIKDLVDNYQPDLLYTDGALPFEEYGLSLVAHHYNLSAQARRQSRSSLHQQAPRRLRSRHVRARHGTRHRGQDLAQPVADRHLRRPVALQAGSEVQDAQDRDRYAVRYREPQRQPDAEFPAARIGELDAEELRDPRGDHRLDGGE